MIKVLGLVGLLAGSLVLGNAGVVEAACARASDRDSAGRLCGGRSAEMRGPTTGYDGRSSGSSSDRAWNDKGTALVDSSGRTYYRAGSSHVFLGAKRSTIIYQTHEGLVFERGTTWINLSKSRSRFDWSNGKAEIKEFGGGTVWLEVRDMNPKTWYDKYSGKYLTQLDGTNYPTEVNSTPTVVDGVIVKGTVIAGGLAIRYGSIYATPQPDPVVQPPAPIVTPKPVVPAPVVQPPVPAPVPAPVYKPAPVVSPAPVVAPKPPTPAKVILTPADITGKATFKMLTNSAPWKTCTGNGVYSGFGGYTSTAQEVKFTGRTCGNLVEFNYTWKNGQTLTPMTVWLDREALAFTGKEF